MVGRGGVAHLSGSIGSKGGRAMGICVQFVSEITLLRSGIECLLEKEGMQLLPAAVCQPPCHRSCYSSKAEVIGMDICSGKFPNMDCIRQIVSRHPSAKIMVFISKEHFSLTKELLRQGARAVLSLSVDTAVLVDAIRGVADGGVFVDPQLAQAMAEISLTESGNPFDRLSVREKTVLQLLLNGHSTEECAALLHISKKTVANHYTQIRKKLGITNKVQLTRLAIRHNLITA